MIDLTKKEEVRVDRKRRYSIVVFSIIFAVSFFQGLPAFTQHTEDETHETDAGHDAHGSEGENFNASEFIFHHIADAYEWHLFSHKDLHVSLPLPVIFYSKNEGLQIFMSSKFEHGHKEVQIGQSVFLISHVGEYSGKLVEVGPNGRTLRPLDFSITKNIASLFFSIILLVWLFSSIAKRYKANPNAAPKGVQSLFEPVILFVRDEIAKPSIGHKYEKFMPYLLTVFFFIWFNNMLGLIPFIPGGANLTGNIAVTLVLALFTFIITNINGTKNYWTHIFNTPGVPWWLKFPVPLMPAIELFGAITKPVVLMIRLFANISAGHIITLGFLSLIFIFGNISPVIGFSVSPASVLFLIFMTFLELLVAFIQAYVFTFLSALYFGMAVEEHH